MHINYISTMKRVGEISNRADHDLKLRLVQDANISRDEIKDKRGRVYAIVVDGVIEKLGGSQDQGGIAGTFGAYLGGYAPKMSLRTYCVWNFMKQAVQAGKKVEVYCVWADTVELDVPTMTGALRQTITIDYHAIEKNFVDEYVKIESKYPFLNMQESGRKWQDTGLSEGYPGMGN